MAAVEQAIHQPAFVSNLKQRLVQDSIDQKEDTIPSQKVSSQSVEYSDAMKLAENMSAAELSERIKHSAYIDGNSPMTAYEWFKFIILLPTVIPRLILAVLALGQLNIISHFATFGIDPLKPMAPWRGQLVRENARFVSRFCLLCLGFWTVDVKGREHLVTGDSIGAIACFTHTNYLDPLVLIQLIAPAFIAKSGVALLTLIGRIAIALQVIFVSRRASQDKRNPYSLKGRATDVMRERYKDAAAYPMLAMAPEATTKVDNCLLQFQTGAFVLGRPVVPVGITYPSKHFNMGWGLLDGRVHLVRMMTQFRNYLTVEVMPVYYPSEAEKKDPKLYAENVRALMSKHFDLPLVDQGVTDCTILQKAGVAEKWNGKGIYFIKENTD